MASTTQQSRQLDQRPTTPVSDSSPMFDLVGIGFGPAQIATAIAHHESKQSTKILFLEQKPTFSWQSSHVPRSRMENPFVYDLATNRNPKSSFTYVNYLFAKKRLVEFANSDRLNPLRTEFAEYLGWCADHFKENVRYQHEVIGLHSEKEAGVVKKWKVAVRSKSGHIYVVRAKSIVVPPPSSSNQHKLNSLNRVNFEAGQRILTFDDYLQRRNEMWEPREPRLNLTIVGSSHRMLEILDDLLSCHILGNITAVTDNDLFATVQTLTDGPSTPEPRLCSIWARPSCEAKNTLTASSELIQRIYARGYEKHVLSKGACALRIVPGQSSDVPSCESSLIITENAEKLSSNSNALFKEMDSLVLGCRQRGESLEEVQFKRGAVADGCRLWLMSAKSEAGRSMAKDLAVRAGEVVKSLSAVDEGHEESVLVNARM